MATDNNAGEFAKHLYTGPKPLAGCALSVCALILAIAKCPLWNHSQPHPSNMLFMPAYNSTAQDAVVNKEYHIPDECTNLGFQCYASCKGWRYLVWKTEDSPWRKPVIDICFPLKRTCDWHQSVNRVGHNKTMKMIDRQYHNSTSNWK